MGYRLSISTIVEFYYGTKLFGYVDDETTLKSYKFLKDHEYLDGDEVWTYNCDNTIAIRKTEFEEFRKLYAQDLKDNYDEIVSNDFLKETEELTNLSDYDYLVLKWE